MTQSLAKTNYSFPALQIYLARTLIDTEEIVRSARHNLSLSSRLFQKGNSIEDIDLHARWTHAMNVADRALCCIKTCRQALENSCGLVTQVIACILCAVEAYQDSLHEALQSTRCYPVKNCKEHVQMSEKQECKAMYLTCAFEAIHGNSDHDLAQLWSLAARTLNEEIQLKQETSYQSVTTTKNNLQKAESINDNITRNKHHWSAKLLCLYERQLRNNRRAAAMSALQRPHLYNYAVETCSKAIEVRARIDRSELDAELKILERASSNLQQALEIIEANAEDGLSETFNTTKFTNQALIAAANQLIQNADRAFEFVAAVDNRKAELACTVSAEGKFRDPTMRRVWQILRAEQEEALLRTEACLQDILRSDGPIVASVELIRSVAVNVKRLISTVDEVSLCHQRITLYKQKAVQSLQKDQSAGLAHKCWTQAAVHMEAAAQVCIDVILNGSYNNMHLDNAPKWNSLCDSTKQFVAIAENVLASAGVYLDKASGAEAGVGNGQDPREAQMWRQAAECLVQKAERQYNQAISTGEIWFFTEDTGNETELDETILSYTQTAEYLHLAFKHRALPNADIRQNGSRVASWYECAAELLYRLLDSHDTMTETVLAFHEQAIDRLNKREEISKEELVLWENGCAYGMLACNTSSVNNLVARHWTGAFLLTQKVLQSSAFKQITSNAQIALQVCAAKATSLQVQIVYEACINELSTIGVYTLESADAKYRLALLPHMIDAAKTAVGNEFFHVLPELQTVLDLSSNHKYQSSLLDKHAQALLQKAKCLHKLETIADEASERESWEEAYSATIDLCQACDLCSVELPTGQNSLCLLLHLAYRKAVAECQVAAAESGISTMHSKALTADALAEAAAVWPKIAATETAGISDNRIALIAVEQYTWAAKQAELQVAACALSTQERRIANALQGRLQQAAEAAKAWYLSPDDQNAKDNFYHYEGNAMICAQQLWCQGVNVDAYSLRWGE